MTPHAQYLALGDTEGARREAYRRLFRSELDPEVVQEIRDATNGNLALGGERFKKQVEAMLGRRVSRGQRGRPRKTRKTDERSRPTADLSEEPAS
ncbi:MAG: transposase [Gammaproteobacteria bacterium]